MMKRNLLILSVFFVLFPLTAVEQSFSVSATYSNGMINEYVLSDESKKKDNILSRLDWDIKNTLNIDLSYTYFSNKLYFNTQLFSSITPSFGILQDFDWQNATDFPGDDPEEISNYSKHYLTKFNILGLSLSYGSPLLPDQNFSFIPLISLDFTHSYFSSSNGYRTYKSENWKKINMKGDIISYQQFLGSIFVGYNAIVKNPSFEFATAMLLSPLLTFSYSLDRHFLRHSVFNDTPLFAFRLKFCIDGKLKINSFNQIGLSYKLDYMPLSSGKTYSATIYDKKLNIYDLLWFEDISAEGGTGRFIQGLSLSYTFLF